MESIYEHQVTMSYTNDYEYMPYATTAGDEKDFIKWCYPDIADNGGPEVGSKAILTSKNNDVEYLNKLAINMMSGDSLICYSTDSIDNDDSGNTSMLL